MRSIYTIGETLLDIIFKNDQPYTANVGGACLNTSVTLGRLGLPVKFISEYGSDKSGDLINNFLLQNNVSTEFIYRYSSGKSALALAFLDENNDACYDFYKIYPHNRLAIEFPQLQENDIVLFGSYYAINQSVRTKLLQFITEALQKKAIVLYDPNFRKQHLPELPQLKPMIDENVSLASLVRGSNEDFMHLWGAKNAMATFSCLGNNPPCLIYTSSGTEVILKTPNLVKSYPVKEIITKSTIGAGDNFNAGIIYALYKNNIRLNQLMELKIEIWDELIETAIIFAQHVCESYDNYISDEFAEAYKL